MKFICLTALLTLSAVAAASSVDLGGTSVEVPAPANFVRVTPEMSKVFALQSEFVVPTNDQLAFFISQDEASAALADEIPDVQRRFSIQIAKKIRSYSASESDFRQFKVMFKGDIDKLFSDAKVKLADPLAKASANVSKQLDTELSLKISGFVPFPAHIDNDQMLAFSVLAKNEVKTTEGTFVDISSNTATLLYVNRRILFLYVYGGKNDLEWTREQSQIWANAILDANPESAQMAESTRTSDHRSGIDWERVAGKAIAGGILALIIGMFGWSTNRRKES